jgi:asparagine synthase (glutamine-hydrolysing)
MCGIAGFCNRPSNWKENIERMNRRMFHRGPDAGGIWANEDASVVLGHRRLSIIDLSENGAQPMQSKSGRFMCVFNGEIYNYRKIKDRLLSDGKVSGFRGTSDTEVLLEAFEAYGVKETLKMCKGMFAIALYDKETGKLTLMRDRIGEKPLYASLTILTMKSIQRCYSSILSTVISRHHIRYTRTFINWTQAVSWNTTPRSQPTSQR